MFGIEISQTVSYKAIQRAQKVSTFHHVFAILTVLINHSDFEKSETAFHRLDSFQASQATSATFAHHLIHANHTLSHCDHQKVNIVAKSATVHTTQNHALIHLSCVLKSLQAKSFAVKAALKSSISLVTGKIHNHTSAKSALNLSSQDNHSEISV
ncbi:MAG: hypothetical protein EOM78_20630 [Erysipelotrichia bacterium]|nr:hypothetical protein [Erysipelotrichia bacterium]